MNLVELRKADVDKNESGVWVDPSAVYAVEEHFYQGHVNHWITKIWVADETFSLQGRAEHYIALLKGGGKLL